jgi:hypothetical protein
VIADSSGAFGLMSPLRASAEAHRVAAAGDVVVVAVVAVQVVGAVVQPAQRPGRVVRAALAGVVVDHVENHLEPGSMQVADHGLELGDLFAGVAAAGVRAVRGVEGQRVVTPVVDQPTSGDGRLGAELMHRKQLDGGDPEPGQLLDHGRMGESRVRPAQLGWHLGMPHREPAYMGLVDDRLGPRRPWRSIPGPVELLVDHDTGPPVAVPHDSPGVRVDQEPLRVEPAAVLRLVWTVDAQAVPRADRQRLQLAVPDTVGALGQPQPVLATVLVEQAERHRRRLWRPHGGVGPVLDGAQPEDMGTARPLDRQYGHGMTSFRTTCQPHVAPRGKWGLTTFAG